MGFIEFIGLKHNKHNKHNGRNKHKELNHFVMDDQISQGREVVAQSRR